MNSGISPYWMRSSGRQCSKISPVSRCSLDWMAAPSGAPPYAVLRERAERVTFGKIAVLVASLDDLESMKRAAGRPRDLVDVEEIEVIRRLKRRTPRT